MERKIGEIFEVEGQWYQCVESKQDACTDCAFNPINGIGYNCSGSCTYKQVIFKKLEKVGESYMTGNKLIQRYKIYPTTCCINVYGWYYQNLDIKSWTIDIEIKQTKEDMEEKNKAEGLPLLRLVGKYMNSLIDYATFEKAVKDLYSNKEESKPTLKEFDINLAKSGKPVCTRDGSKARIVCFDRKDNAPIIALIERVDGIEILQCYHNDGKCFHDETSNNDLMMLPEKKEGWVNLYKSSVRSTKEEAMKYRNKCNDYIDTIKIEWEE